MSDSPPRVDSAEHWDDAAAGWARQQEFMRLYTEPLSRWLVDHIEPRAGQRVLELAAGLGETGFAAAPLLRPGGVLVTSDQSERMLAAARARAAELGLENVEFKLMSAEWIDEPVASVDGVLCRWGFMLMADPAAALRETRRVLRPGGRLALAVWDALERNPWAALPGAVLRERGLGRPPDPGAPGPFALGDAGRLRALLEDAGFQEVSVEPLDLVEEHPDFESFWERLLDLGRSFHDAVLSQDDATITELHEELAARLAPYTAPDGSLALPARTLAASACA